MTKQLDLFEVFNARSSNRSFTGEAIDDETIDKILQAAITAPSSGNMQPWEFIIIKSEEKKEEIISTTFTGYFAGEDNQQTWLKDTGFILVLAANIKRTKARYGEMAAKYWPIIDTTIAGEHTVLAATALGIGSCWIGGYDEEKLKHVVNLPNYVKPVAIIAFGHIKESGRRLNRMKTDLVRHDEEYGAS